MASETLEVTTPVPADQPAPPITEETPENIEARMHRTQEALAGKLDVLEQQAFGDIRDTLGAVTDTVSTVQNAVNDPVGTVQAAVMNPFESVANGLKSSMGDMVRDFDPSDAIRRQPLQAVGVAVAGGVVAGLILFSRAKPAAAPGAAPTLFQTLMSGVTAELTAVGREVLSTMSKSVKERVMSAVSFPPSPPTPPTTQI